MSSSPHIRYQRRRSTIVNVGGIAMGGDNPVRVQTMCTTHTVNIAESVAQCKRIADAGADYVRLTTQGLREVEALKEIKQQLRSEAYNIPLIADVHFNANVALAAAVVADKVRINPGNFARSAEESEQRLIQLLTVCRTHGAALRIGVNHGSLAPRIMEQHGDTPEGMLVSAMEMLRICRREQFDQVVVSMKSSNTRIMVQAYRLLVDAMDQENMHYPLHLGVTEAGDGDDGRIKSAVGIGTLLAQGLGDTIRVSLTEAPENEVPVARALTAIAPQYPYAPEKYRAKETLQCVYRVNTFEELLLRASCEAGPPLLDGLVRNLHITAHMSREKVPDNVTEQLSLDILQAARVRFSKPEYIACPGCGRTLFDLQATLALVRSYTKHLRGLKIAVMGCIVNGPGEMADADYGYVGAGPGKISLYKGKKMIKNNIPQDEAIHELICLIKESGDWKDL